ncbi:initiation factor 2B [Thermosipho globiformans]|uniref:initiation factor 2B n=1 Tax=Thermosipho globiformans TaxID=380685 RepID=UPI000F8CF0B2|nr:initiation factor 2B [Thermosipho globiformans]
MIEKFKKLTVQGSHEIAEWILENIKNIDDKEPILKDMIKLKPEMQVIKWIYKMIKENNDIKDIKEILDTTFDNTIKNAKKFLNFDAKVMTISNSKTLECFFKTHRKKLKIYIPESNPGGEGKILYKNLLNYKKNVYLINDFEVHRYIVNCDYVIIGADSVGENGVINKVGSKLLAILSKSFNIPLFVIADQTKFTKTVSEREKIFEIVPNNLITAIISG